MHTQDNLQINLWLKTNIARLRLAHVDTVLAAVQADEPLDPESVKHTGWAIADIGYCLRQKPQKGLLKNMGRDVSFSEAIELTGDYIADGHPEAIADNLDLIRLARQEQGNRASYWAERYDASVMALGQRLPDQELAMDTDLDNLIRVLYSQQSESYQIAA